MARLVVSLLVAIGTARAGPPYTTDDPEPVPLHAWEVYAATVTERGLEGWTGTAPHFEVNYGAAPEVQVHLITPLVYSAPRSGNFAYGPGDAELGIKVRFVGEGQTTPQIGIFPLVELPTGDSARGLGEAHVRVFLPIWFQKTFGAWTTYGGGGYWFNRGRNNRDWFYAGWQVQRQLTPRLTAGIEVYHTTPTAAGDRHETRFNIGSTLDLTGRSHLLVSVGRGIQGANRLQAYFAYLLTIAPATKETQ
jgi:hypothetical protein